jgi:hypothetical protein
MPSTSSQTAAGDGDDGRSANGLLAGPGRGIDIPPGSASATGRSSDGTTAGNCAAVSGRTAPGTIGSGAGAAVPVHTAIVGISQTGRSTRVSGNGSRTCGPAFRVAALLAAGGGSRRPAPL